MRGMRHFLAALLTAALLLSLAACGSTNSAGQLRLYYPAELSTKSRSTGGGDAIASVQVDWQQIGGDQLGRQQQAQYIMEQLLGACKAPGFTSPVPDGTALRSCTVTGGTVSVDLQQRIRPSYRHRPHHRRLLHHPVAAAAHRHLRRAHHGDGRVACQP